MSYYNDAEIHAAAARILPTLSPVRAALVSDALSLDGLEPASERYQTELYPNDPPNQRRALALRQSGCGITVEHGDRAAGVDDARLWMPYGERAVRGGVLYPLTLSIHIATRAKCWVRPVPMDARLPMEGDAVVVGNPGADIGTWSKGGGFGGAHIFRVVATAYAASSDRAIVHSVDGGQPGIHVRTRALVWCGPGGSELWAASLDDQGGFVFDAADGRPSRGRRVYGWVDVDGLPIRSA
jgi:hypothetical protein